jgi:hypothetical protein
MRQGHVLRHGTMGAFMIFYNKCMFSDMCSVDCADMRGTVASTFCAIESLQQLATHPAMLGVFS